MKYLYYIIFFFSIQIYSQSKLTIVEYKDMKKNAPAGKLFFSNDESLFEKFIEKQSTKPVQYSDGSIVYPPNSIDSIANKKRIIYFNLKNKYFINNSITNDREFIIKDTSLAQWKILPDFKEIMGIKCQKASGTYYGKSYIAWFSLQNKVPFGPLKMNNLPGLILEVQSDDGSLNYLATKMETNPNNSEFQKECETLKQRKSMSFEEYQKEFSKIINKKPELH